MIMEVLTALTKHTDLLRIVQEEYQYILADEHQDVNGAQNKVLELLASFHEPYPNLFIVGDEKQAIFRFQGASLENFLYFKKRYPKALLISLTQNYRSPQFVLDAAQSLIANTSSTEKDFHPPLLAMQKKKEGAVRILSFPRERDEHTYIANKVQSLITAGAIPSEIAILFRDNKDAAPLAHALEETSTPFTVYADENILDDPLLTRLLILLRGIHDIGNDAYLSQLLLLDFLNNDPLDVYLVLAHAQRKKISIAHILRSENSLHTLSLAHPQTLTLLMKNLVSWKRRAENESFATLLHEVAHESGYINFLIARADAPHALDKLHALYDEARENSLRHKKYRLADFLREVSVREEYGVALRKKGGVYLTESVELMTAHRSKGLEFSHVFITGALDKKWGGRRAPNALALPFLEVSSQKEDDERRLFYVAATRAKKDLTITYAEEDAEGKMLLPSRFIEEINKRFKIHEKKAPVKSTSIIHVPRKLSSRIPRMERAYLAQRFAEQSFSVTALNNYIECPWKYFYTNLLRIPQIEKPHQMYGTAMHEALRALFYSLAHDIRVTEKTALQSFNKTFSQFPLSESIRHRYEKKGKEALRAYYREYKKTWNTRVRLEYKLSGTLPELPMRLSGALDKIEFVGTGIEVNVVDYKTGRHHSRNELLGKTKGSSGNEVRQLAFYKLLLDTFAKKEFQFVSGELDFIEPDERGRFHREKFFITDTERDELFELIKKIAKEIESLSFWDTTCEKKDCVFCALRKRTGAQLIKN